MLETRLEPHGGARLPGKVPLLTSRVQSSGSLPGRGTLTGALRRRPPSAGFLLSEGARPLRGSSCPRAPALCGVPPVLGRPPSAGFFLSSSAGFLLSEGARPLRGSPCPRAPTSPHIGPRPSLLVLEKTAQGVTLCPCRCQDTDRRRGALSPGTAQHLANLPEVSRCPLGHSCPPARQGHVSRAAACPVTTEPRPRREGDLEPSKGCIFRLF